MTARKVDRDIFGRPPRHRSDWSHRRGEPRTFALAWTIFLMLSTLVMFASISAALVVTPDLYRPATRALILTITAGIVLVWPMVRLCQNRPHRSALPEIARDILIVLIPVQALIWPQSLMMLGGWSIELCALVAATQSAWAILIGGMLALALTMDPLRGRVDFNRGAWMVLITLIAVGSPIVQLVLGSIDPVALPTQDRVSFYLSPLTSLFQIIRNHAVENITGIGAQPWWAVAVVSCAGAGVWVIAGIVERARTGKRA